MKKTDSTIVRAVKRTVRGVKQCALRKLAECILWQGDYLALSTEEFILRLHKDEYNDGQVRQRDVEPMRKLFLQLNDAYHRSQAFDMALKRLAASGAIVLGRESDGQACFQTSRIKHPEKYQELLRTVRQRFELSGRIGIGSINDLRSSDLIPLSGIKLLRRPRWQQLLP